MDFVPGKMQGPSAYQTNTELKPYGRREGEDGEKKKQLLKPELIKSITWLMWKRVCELEEEGGSRSLSTEKAADLAFSVTF